MVNALRRLKDVGAVDKLPDGEVALKTVELPEAVEAASRAHEAREERKSERIDPMRTYADITGCRRQFLLRYFGDVCRAVPALRQLPQVNRRNRHSAAAGTRREVTA